MDTKNKLRSAVRKSSKLSEQLQSSLQTLSSLDCERYLSERIEYLSQTKFSLETSHHVDNLKGLRAVLAILMANIPLSGKEVRLSFMDFDEAFSLFLSYRPLSVKSLLKDRHQKKRFTDLMCHPSHGIPVYIVKQKYLLLMSSDVDLDLFFEHLFKDPEVGADKLSSGDIQDMLESLDTAWDKKVMKVVLGDSLSKSEQQKLGIGSRVNKYHKQVMKTIQSKKVVRDEAKAAVMEDLKTRIRKIEKCIWNERQKLEKVSQFWTKSQLDELEEKIEDLEEKQHRFQEIVEHSDSKSFKEMVSRKYEQIIVERRVGMRRASSGRPKSLDEVDESFLLDCIEHKSTAHGRRHDAVMYTSHRVKKRDFLKLANYSRLSRGLKPIKSATTVYNRARPRNCRSLQAKRHLGLGLFCSKKPPKLQENDNILTHYQRAFKKGILVRQINTSKADGADYNLFISRDDKAYICPGTSTGNVIDKKHI